MNAARLLKAGGKLQSDVAWALASFGALNFIRFSLNLCLAWLLNPAIFGIMTIINTFRTGVELISDVGVGQSIIVNAEGDQPSFLRTAWSVQALRGGILFLIGLAAAVPVQLFYKEPGLGGMVALASVIFLFTGLVPPTRPLFQRNRQTRTMSLVELVTASLGAIVTLACAWAMPSAWGMVIATVAASLTTVVVLTLLYRGPKLRFEFDRERIGQILHFGRWIFASSLIFFASTNVDRIYLPTFLPLAVFGVYGIARSLGDMVTQLMQRLGSMIIFPGVARAGRETVTERAAHIGRLRLIGLGLITVGIAAGTAGGDLFVRLAYDHRYAAAQVMVPVLFAGTWFSVQATMADAVLLGLAAPARAAAGNAAKLAWVVVLMPLGVHWHGTFGAVLVIALADLPRYAMLAVGQHRIGLSFWRQDIGLILAGLALVLVFREGMVQLGLVDGLVSSAQRGFIAALSR